MAQVAGGVDPSQLAGDVTQVLLLNDSLPTGTLTPEPLPSGDGSPPRFVPPQPGWGLGYAYAAFDGPSVLPPARELEAQAGLMLPPPLPATGPQRSSSRSSRKSSSASGSAQSSRPSSRGRRDISMRGSHREDGPMSSATALSRKRKSSPGEGSGSSQLATAKKPFTFHQYTADGDGNVKKPRKMSRSARRSEEELINDRAVSEASNDVQTQETIRSLAHEFGVSVKRVCDMYTTWGGDFGRIRARLQRQIAEHNAEFQVGSSSSSES